MSIIEWSRLSHCPNNQLIKGGDPTDAGFDIAIAKDVLIKNYETLDREKLWKWEIVGPSNGLAIPELKDMSYISNFMSNQGAFTISSLQVIYGEIAELQEIVDKYSDDLYDSAVRPSDLESQFLGNYYLIFRSTAHNPVMHLGKQFFTIPFVLRKKYKPELIPTGIQINPKSLMWTAIVLRSSMRSYGIGISHAIGVVDNSYVGHELMLSVYAIGDNVPFRKGERLAQLIPIPQEEIELRLVDSISILDPNRTGFGSTGIN